MHAFLIISSDKEKIEERIITILDQKASTRMDFSLEKIADVRDLKSMLKVNMGTNTTLVIQNFNTVSLDAQNAFLKELEEPQEKVSYILISPTNEAILPTVLSRCEVIDLRSHQVDLSPEDEDKLTAFLKSSKGEQLKFVSNLKDRGEAISFLENLQILIHKQLTTKSTTTHHAKIIANTLAALKANGNVQLQLTHFITHI